MFVLLKFNRSSVGFTFIMIRFYGKLSHHIFEREIKDVKWQYYTISPQFLEGYAMRSYPKIESGNPVAIHLTTLKGTEAIALTN